MGLRVKHIFHLALIVPALILGGCGGKKSNSQSSISNQYKLDAFHDIDNTSTLNMDELKDLPRVVDLKSDMTPAKDQADRGTCTFFTVIGLVESAVKKKMNVEVNLSEEYLNYVVKSQKSRSSLKEGSDPGFNLNYLNKAKAGFLLERDWPYQPSWFGAKAPCKDFVSGNAKAPAECYSHQEPAKEIIAKSIPGENFEYFEYEDFSTNDLIKEIAKSKLPYSIVLPVNYDGWPDDGVINYTEEMRQDCITKKAECGNHAVVITGYDLDKKVFFIKNSWGRKWGKDGFGTLPFDFLDRHIDHYTVFVKMITEFKLPENFNTVGYKLKSFTVKSKQNNDNSITVSTSAEVETAGLYTIDHSARLVKVPAAGYYSPSDENAKVLFSTEEEFEKYNIDELGAINFSFADAAITTRKWDEGANVLTIPQSHMELPSVQSILFSQQEKLMVRTSLNVFTDEGYKALKRYYHPLNFSPLK